MIVQEFLKRVDQLREAGGVYKQALEAYIAFTDKLDPEEEELLRNSEAARKAAQETLDIIFELSA